MALLTLVGMTVVGVDIGRLAFTATEVQAVAEVAATGYAHEWVRGVVQSNSDPGDGACRSAAAGVIDGNRIDSIIATNANVEAYDRGFYDFTTYGPFTTAIPAGETANAVRATATATVNNFFAGLFGGSQSTVRKTAVATLTCPGRERPIPLAIGDCQFGGFDGPEDCADLPSLTQQTVSFDNSCWTSLSTSASANTADLSNYIRTVCGLGPSTQPPEVSQGQDIRVSEGTHNSLCFDFQDCWDANKRTFTVPIVSCDEFIACASHGTNSLTVSGFAEIELSERPKCTGSAGPPCDCTDVPAGVPCAPSNKCIPLHSLCSSSGGEGVGGNCDFGRMKVGMVE